MKNHEFKSTVALPKKSYILKQKEFFPNSHAILLTNYLYMYL